MNKKKIILVGCTPNNLSFVNVLVKLNYEVVAIVDDRNIKSSKFENIKILNYKQIQSFYKDQYFFIAIGDNYLRQKYVKKIKKILPNAFFPTICDPSSRISEEINLGEGNIIGPFCNIGYNCVFKDFNLISSHCAFNHDIETGSFNFYGNGVKVLGGTNISSYVSVYANSIISRKLKISSNVVIGINSFVKSDISANSLNYGNPTKFIRKLKKNETLITS